MTVWSYLPYIPGAENDPIDDEEETSYVSDKSVDHRLNIADESSPSTQSSSPSIQSLDSDDLDSDENDHKNPAQKAEALLEKLEKNDVPAAEAYLEVSLILRTEIYKYAHSILLTQRTIHDAVILAAEQVQDKRIDFLEEGPEVDADVFFLELAIGIAFGSPLFGTVVSGLIGKIFSYVRRQSNITAQKQMADLLSNARKVSLKYGREIKSLGRGARQIDEELQKAERFKALAEGFEKLPGGSSISTIANEARDEVDRLRSLRSSAQESIKSVKGQLNTSWETYNKEKGDVKKDYLAKWAGYKKLVKSTQGEAANILGKATEKVVSPILKQYPASPSPILPSSMHSIGVSIRNRAQLYLRRQESYVYSVMTATDQLVMTAVASPDRALDVVISLIQQAAILEHDIIDNDRRSILKENLIIRFEHLLWVLMWADRIELGSGSLPKEQPFPGTADLLPYFEKYRKQANRKRTAPHKGPPKKVYEYWGNRFSLLYDEEFNIPNLKALDDYDIAELIKYIKQNYVDAEMENLEVQSLLEFKNVIPKGEKEKTEVVDTT